ncbi:hypothetical protein C8F01DRAFT_1193618, partial [Mycena amicta]
KPFPRRRPSLSPHPRYTQNAPASARTTSPVPLLHCQIPWTGAYLGVYFFARAALRVGYLREGRYCYCSLVNLFPGTELVIRHTSSYSGTPIQVECRRLSTPSRQHHYAQMGEGNVLPASACTPWSFISSLSFSYSASLRSPRSRCQDDTR